MVVKSCSGSSDCRVLVIKNKIKYKRTKSYASKKTRHYKQICEYVFSSLIRAYGESYCASGNNFCVHFQQAAFHPDVSDELKSKALQYSSECTTGYINLLEQVLQVRMNQSHF